MTDNSSIQVFWDAVKKIDNSVSPEHSEFLLNLVLKQHVQIISYSSDGEVNVFDEITEDGFITLNELRPDTRYSVRVNAILNYDEGISNKPEFKVNIETLDELGKELNSSAKQEVSANCEQQVATQCTSRPKKPGRKQRGASCDQCDKVFANVRRLNAHKKAHVKNKPHICEICKRAFAWRSSLLVHIKKCHSQRKSPSDNAPADTKSGEEQIKTESPVVVPKVESSTSDNMLLDHHKKDIKRKPRKAVTKKKTRGSEPKTKLLRGYDCIICGKTFVSPSKLEAHMAKHSSNKTHKCDVCSKTFSWGTSLMTHKRKFHANFKPFECHVCHQSFQLRSVLNSHSKIHSSRKSVSCSVCQKAFVSMTYLKYHMRLHTGEKPYVCDICNNSFVSKSLLNYHKAKKHGEQKPYKCNVCNKEFMWQKQLFEHEMEHIGDRIVSENVDKPFRCRTCGKCYSHRRSLRKHAQTHTSPRTHMCEVCGKAFFTSFSLKSHQVVHSTATPFKCTHCPKQFARSISLKLHLTTHTGEKCFICEVCGKGFSNSSNLKVHTIKHSGLKPFQCDLCDKRYTDKSHLSRHKKKVHAPSQSGIENKTVFPQPQLSTSPPIKSLKDSIPVKTLMYSPVPDS